MSRLFRRSFPRSAADSRLPLATLLLPALPLAAQEKFRYDASYQQYKEASDRMLIESWYYRTEMHLDEQTLVRFQLLRDAVSGATPTGALPGGGQPFLAEIEDVRHGILAALSRQVGDHRLELELSRSSESDYLSNGLSISDHWELNQKNTTLSAGLNYLDDSVRVIGIPYQKKYSYDLFLGLSQILDKNTILSANVTVGYNEGYLNDPYKAIQRTDSVPDGLGGTIDVVNLYRENRPAERLRTVLQLQGTHFFDGPQAALDALWRISNDDFGVFSQTWQLEWRQSLWGGRLELIPFGRYYLQSAADFFHNSLDEVSGARAEDFPMGRGPHYSADYRLSSLQTASLGLKLRLRLGEHCSLSAACEDYRMQGRGSRQAPTEAYPRARLVTVGVSFQF